MAESSQCPQCGAEVPADAPQGLCPRCVLKAGFGTQPTDQALPARAESAATSPFDAPYEPPTPTELAPHFPELEILELVGRGGMGMVYKARQKRLDRLVALKILAPRIGQDPAFAERFAREARALALLSHPHIVAVHDFGQTDDLYYFLMEFVDGVNLRRLLDTGKLAPEEALAIVPQVCEALQYAHDHRVVHRDIKPENVLLDKEGRVKIADFGIAKLVGREPSDRTLTGEGQIIGTPQYMAPEQIEHPLEVDHRADIYSLGVVFYQMLTGELPLGRFAPPSKKVQIDVRLDDVVLRALEKEPERRYQQADEIRTRVETIATTPVADHTPSRMLEKPIFEQAKQQVKGPAIGLLVTGILNWVVSVPLLMLVLPVAQAAAARSETVVTSVLALLLVNSLMIFAALKMKWLQAYGLAIIASILAIIISPGNLIGLPIGIWALVVLSQREVRAAFAEIRDANRSATSSGRPGTLTAGMRLVLLMVVVGGVGIGVLFFLPRTRTMLPQQPQAPAPVVNALEEYRQTLVGYDLGFDSVFPQQKWTGYDAARLEMYPTKDAWPHVLGHVDTRPNAFNVVENESAYPSNPIAGPHAFLVPLDRGLVADSAYVTLLFLNGISPKGTVVANTYASLVCLGPMEGQLNFGSYATALLKGDVSGRITSQSYFNLVVTGKFTGRIQADSYAMIYLMGGCEGNIQLKHNAKVYLAGRTMQAALSRITGQGRVFLEDSDLPRGVHSIGDLSVAVGREPDVAKPSGGAVAIEAAKPVPKSQNLLKNPGIETGDKTPDAWRQGAALEGVTYSWDKNVAFEGTASLGIEKTAPTYFPVAQWSQNVERQGTASTLSVSAQVKAEKMTKAILDVVFLDGQGNWVSHQWVAYIGAKAQGDPPADHDWKLYAGNVQIPPETKTLSIGLQVYGPGKIWFDDVRAGYAETNAEPQYGSWGTDRDGSPKLAILIEK